MRWIAQALPRQTVLANFTGRLALAEAAGRRGVEVAEHIDDADPSVTPARRRLSPGGRHELGWQRAGTVMTPGLAGHY